VKSKELCVGTVKKGKVRGKRKNEKTLPPSSSPAHRDCSLRTRQMRMNGERFFLLCSVVRRPIQDRRLSVKGSEWCTPQEAVDTKKGIGMKFSRVKIP